MKLRRLVAVLLTMVFVFSLPAIAFAQEETTNVVIDDNAPQETLPPSQPELPEPDPSQEPELPDVSEQPDIEPTPPPETNEVITETAAEEITSEDPAAQPQISSYSALKNAIESANPNDTIYVSGGTIIFEGLITIDKPLNIVGTGQNDTILMMPGTVGSHHFYISNLDVDGATVSFSNLTVRGPGQDGLRDKPTNGGINMKSQTDLLRQIAFTNVTIENCITTSYNYYGPVRLHNSNLTMKNCTVKNNSSVNFSVVHVDSPNFGGNCVIDNSTFSKNKSSNYFSADGGALYIGKKLTMSNCTVNDNSASSFGGGIYVESDAVLNNCKIMNNKSGSRGGGVYSGGSVTMDNSTISGNSGFDGGGIYAKNDSSFVKSTISGNSGYEGGGIHVGNGATMKNCTVANNRASYGGGMYSNYATIISSTFSGNSAVGGGICIENAPNLRGSVFAGNFDRDGEKADDVTVLSRNYLYRVTTGGEVNKAAIEWLNRDSAYYVIGTSSKGISSMFELNKYGEPLLKDNGGSNYTIMPKSSSVLVTQGIEKTSETSSWLPSTDQRGSGRSGAKIATIGAVEVPYTPPIVQPQINKVTPSGNGAALSGNVKITFNKEMDKTAGSVVIVRGTSRKVLNGATWSGNTVSFPYKGLGYNKKYTLQIEGFKDTEGRVVPTSTSRSFVTATGKPQKFRYTNKTATTVTMWWNAEKNADYYRLYRKVNGKYKLVKTLQGKNKITYTFTGLKPNTKQYFKIIAVNRTDGVSHIGVPAYAKAQTNKR